MAYQDRRHHADHGDSSRHRRDGDRHGFGRRKRFDDGDDRSRRSHHSGWSSDSHDGRRRSQGRIRDEGGTGAEHRRRDDWRAERRRDGGSDERRPVRGDNKSGRFNSRSGSGGPGDGKNERRGRPPQRQRIPEPNIPDDVEPGDLERGAKGQLRALGRANAENVARHLVMTQRLLDDDPQTAYEHARYAASHAGRVAVVRETAGIAAYLAGHYSEALREIRAARRLSGLDLHRAIEVDCERALGHLDKALQAAKATDPRQLDEIERAELAMVVSGLRHELGQTDLGLIVIEDAIRARPSDSDTLRRLHSVRADRLEELGRHQEAAAVRDRIGAEPIEEDEVEVFDIEDDYDAEMQEQGSPGTDDRAGGAEALAASEAPTGGQSSDLEPADQEDAEWPQSFAERVEAEMTELLEAAEDDSMSLTADDTGGPSPDSPDDAAGTSDPMMTATDDVPEEPR